MPMSHRHQMCPIALTTSSQLLPRFVPDKFLSCSTGSQEKSLWWLLGGEIGVSLARRGPTHSATSMQSIKHVASDGFWGSTKAEQLCKAVTIVAW